ncbi:MAG: LamG-like jellyroll fold domain-containing protein [Verrucomicrobiota bacterium]
MKLPFVLLSIASFAAAQPASVFKPASQADLAAKQSIPVPASAAVSRSEVTPVDMTWKRVGTARPFQTIDEAHLHFVSNWESGQVGPFYTPNDAQSRILNTSITVANQRAVITTGGGLAKSIPCNVQSKAPWVSVEATVYAAPSAGGGGVGPAIIRDIDRFIWFKYDHGSGNLQLVEQSNGATIKYVSVAHSPVYPLKLTVKLTGTTITGWVGDKLIAVLSGTPLVDYRDPAIWATYYYGLRANDVTAQVTKLRAGPSGVLGGENILAVTRGDGSPYFIGKKLVMTGDMHGVGGLEGWNSCILLVDLDTAQMEVIGRIYYSQDFDGVTKLEGGNFTRLQYHEDTGRWLITVLTFHDWGPLGVGSPNGWDSYGWVDIDLYGENFIPKTQLTTLGFLSTPGFGYGAKVWKEGSTWHALCSISASAGNEDDPAAYVALRPCYYTGPSLNSLSPVWRDETTPQVEGGTHCRMNGLNYFHWSVAGEYPATAFPTYEAAGTYIGSLKNIGRYGDTVGIDTGESWAEWIPRPTADGKTEFFAIGNTKESFKATVVDQSGAFDVDTGFAGINRGAMAVWKADQQTAGLEFPVYQNDIKVRAAATFSTPATSLATGLRVALPLTADGVDSSAFSRNVSVSGTVGYGVDGATATASSGLWHRELGITPVTGDYTASCVLKYTTGTAYDGFLVNIGLRNNITMISGRPTLTVYNGGSWIAATSSTVILGNTTHHILARKSGTTFTVWLDGVQVATQTIATPDVNPGYLSVGGGINYAGYPNTPTFSNSMLAPIRAVKIWNRALTNGEIASDYNAGTPWMP